MARKTYHVTPGDDGWKVQAEGGSKASAVTPTKAEAVQAAKGFAKNATEGQVIIHGQDGKIQTEHTYGNDPHPPAG